MKVALGVSGGIACYKAAEIVRRLQDQDIDVTVLMTKAAAQFVTPLTFRALSGNKVYLDIFEGPRSGGDFEGAFDHILLAQSVDLFLIAPATADCIARLAAGIARDEANALADTAVASLEGAFMLSRARRDTQPLRNAGRHVRQLVETAMTRAPQRRR